MQIKDTSEFKVKKARFQWITQQRKLERVGLGVTLWQGDYEGKQEIWLRWCDQQGNLIPTGRELAEQERREKEQERREKEQALSEIERLRARLREAGLSDDAV